MRISREREELARMQHGQRVSEIEAKYAEQCRRIEYMPRGGVQRAAADRIHIGKLTEVCEAYIAIYLAAFAKEGLVPNPNDLHEMEATIDRMLSNRLGNDFYRPLGSSINEINMLPDNIKHKLRIRVKEMELESRSQAASPSPTYNINIHGDNRGNIQQGGQGNTQNINLDKRQGNLGEEN